MATAIAQKTEKLHAAHAQAVAEEDEASLPSPASPPQVSPERAIQLIQQSGLGNRQMYSVSLTTTATGQLVYDVRVGGSNGTLIQVDAQTGTILTSSSSGH